MKIKLENLNDVKVGDLLCDNITKKPMKVMAVSENYIYAVQNNFGKEYYTVYSKEPEGIYHDGCGWHIPQKNDKRYFFRGPDDHWGYMHKDEITLDAYLDLFEKGELDISWKRRVSLLEIFKVVRK